MKKRNSVFIAQSLDGYIADKNGEIDFLYSVPNPEEKDMGYNAFIEDMDAVVMGRATFEKVLSFDIPWPYNIPVFVVSTSLSSLPAAYDDKVELVKGSLKEILQSIHQKGYYCLYIDGGRLIQSFLKEDRIDELILTTIPVLLGGGYSLFGDLANPMKFELVQSEVYLNAIIQVKYRRSEK